MSETEPSSAPIPDDALTPPTFDVLPLSTETRAALAKMGYEHPTPVQRAVFEPATRGKDLVVQARTGTGKTTAFGLPIVEHVVRRTLKAVQVLVLCPTRELALQVAREVEKLGEGRGISPVAVYGGAPMGKQIEQLASGAQVVIGTPGRVLDHIRRGTLDTTNVRALVLDEADEMLSMGFERELSAILDALPRERQTLLFSATIPPDIERISRERLRQPEFITLSGDAVGALSIQHFVYFVTEDKVTAFLKILEVENPESAIVFCNTKVETENVAGALQRAGYDADWLNGDLPQNEREEVMARTRQGKLRFLVATDVAARGIDISHLTHVINYDFPDSAEQYVHRTGRTGRAGRTGTAISLVRPQDIGNLYILRLTYKIRPFERQIPTAGEMKTRREADLVSMVAEAFLSRAVHPDDLALARRLMAHDRAETIVAGLLRDHLGERQSSEETAAAARRATPPPPPKREVVREPARVEKRVAPPPPPREERSIPSIPGGTEQAAPSEDRERSGRGPRPPREPRGRDRFRDRDRDRERGGDRDRDRPSFEPVRYTVSDVEPHAPPPPAAPPSEEQPTRRRSARDLANWHPPEEEGDDRPILAAGSEPPPVTAESVPSEPAESTGDREGREEPGADYAVVFVDVGRRDGARPADFQRVLRDRGGISRRDTGRIRVRDKHALISVKREVLEKAIVALAGAEIAGRVARAEPARERPAAEEALAMADRARPDDPAKLRRAVEFALRNEFAPDEVVPMIEALARAAEKGSPPWIYANRQLAEILVERAPWRAAIAARATTAHAPEDDGAHALLGLALTVLGHYRYASKSYEKAIAIAPDNPWYAHNLGHLYDVALDEPRLAVPLLRRAHKREQHVEIAASLAHALGRIGRVAEAKKVLLRALGESAPSQEHGALLGWLESGAPGRKPAPAREAPPARRRKRTRDA